MVDDGDFESFAVAFHLLARLAAEVVRSIPIALATGWNVTFSASGQVTMADGAFPEPAFHIGNNSRVIQALSEYAATRETVRSSTSLTKCLASDASSGDAFREDVLWQRVVRMLNKALVPTFAYSEERATTVLSALKGELSKPTTTYRIRAYFRPMGLKLDESLPFANGAVLRPLSHDDIRELIRDSKARMDDGPPAIRVPQFTTVLELSFESGRNILEVDTPRPLADYQTALRLVAGPVAFDYATIEQMSIIHPRFLMALLPYRKGAWKGDDFVMLRAVPLDGQKAASASAYFDCLANSPNAANLATGIRRFNDALERLRLDDAVLDCIIGLESVLTQDSHTEILRRLRQRLSMLIGRSAADRISVDAMVPKLYDARSKIAHGDAPKVPLRDLFETGESYLARLIRELLKAENEFDASELDKAIIRGDARFSEPESWEAGQE